MKLFRIVPILTAMVISHPTHAGETELLEPLRESARRAISESSQIDPQRQADLKKVADFIRQRHAEGKTADLTFICTHNSRRSHLSQLWAQTAAAYYGLTNIATFSGGTEATACNIRTVQALRRAGFSIVQTTNGANPVYLAQFAENGPPAKIYSKVFSAPENPQTDFAALPACDAAAESCPIVTGAALRLPLLYKDPKVSDNTPQEKAIYDERSRQIAREMFYMMSQVNQAHAPAS